MKSLDKIVSAIEKELDEKDRVRESGLKASRDVVRLSGSVVRGLHKNEDCRSELTTLAKQVSALKTNLRGHPDIEHAGYVQSAFQEYAEARILANLLEEDDIPSPKSIGVDGAPYMLGLADCIGELRRFALNELKSGSVEDADCYLDQMEDLFAAIMRFEYPDAIIAIRHKQDVARSLLEKTRGEVAVAATAKKLTERLEAGFRGH